MENTLGIWRRIERPFFLKPNVPGFELHFFGRKKRVAQILKANVLTGLYFFSDQNCDWQSICSGEIVHRASFLMGECVFEATSGGRCISMSCL